MKPIFRTSIFLSVMVLLSVFLASCSQDQSATVKSYNNSIVQIQKDMFSKAQETSKAFGTSNLDPQKVLTGLQTIESDINESHAQFQSMQVPAGAERLYEAMEKFFQTELKGIQEVILGVQYLQGKENDANARKVFTDAFTQFSSQEGTALRDFYATQQQVASKYGQKVINIE